MGRVPRETKAPGPSSSENVAPDERVRLWAGRGLATVVVVVVAEERADDVDGDEGTE